VFYRIAINLAAVVQVVKTKDKLLSEPYDRRFVIGLWIKKLNAFNILPNGKNARKQEQ